MKHTLLSALFLSCFLISCSTHKRSHIKADEEFVVEFKKPATRGGALEIGLQGLFLGANYLAEQTAKSLTSNYSQSLSVNDYYNLHSGNLEKTYNEIHIKKYAKPIEKEDKNELTVTIRDEITNLPKTRGTNAALMVEDFVRQKEDDLLSFHAVIEILNDPENPGVSRLSFNQLRIFFSKTRVYSDENLNAIVSVQIEGQWRNTDGSPNKGILIEQEYDFKNLKYGADNQIKEPLLSPWYYDIPITSEIENNSEFGVVKVNVQVREYEGSKSKYINKLPNILSDNKNAIVKDGASTIEKIIK
ncbi:MAG: hypothetical protein RSF68_02530 [Myroides sp.]